MTSAVTQAGRAAISERTLRRDRWWLEPAYTVAGLTAWLAYGIVHVAMQKWYFAQGDAFSYLTPFYSPCVNEACVPGSAHFGTFVPDWPIIPYALVSLPFLLVFRLTCYYYRRAYYRSYWLAPPACAVPDRHRRYTGETRFPLVLQNLHRYAFYAAVLVSVVNTYDLVLSFHGTRTWGLGLGNLIMLANVWLLWAYTLSCHSCRHIVGGRLRHFSQHPVRYRLWSFVSRLNRRHKQLAWITLGSLALTDFYIMGLAAHWWADLRFIN